MIFISCILLNNSFFNSFVQIIVVRISRSFSLYYIYISSYFFIIASSSKLTLCLCFAPIIPKNLSILLYIYICDVQVNLYAPKLQRFSFDYFVKTIDKTKNGKSLIKTLFLVNILLLPNLYFKRHRTRRGNPIKGQGFSQSTGTNRQIKQIR